jgi:transcriptional regulator with XRE-family HTH domain
MITNFEKAIISNIKRIRIEKGITCQDIADILNTSVNFINNIESEKSDDKYNLNHLNKISYLLDCKISEFFPSDSEIQNEPFFKDIEEQKLIILNKKREK